MKAPAGPWATTIPSRLGTCALAWSPRGALRLLLPAKGSPEARMRAALGEAPRWDELPAALRRAAKRVAAYLDGDHLALRPVAIDIDQTTTFRRAIFEALRGVPAGQTIGYGALAKLAGSPGASRAVGAAMAQNPLPLLVPCHRVVRADGALGEFSAPGGAKTKLTLLTLEGADLTDAWRAAPRELTRRDQQLAKVISRIGPCQLRPRDEGGIFRSLARAIVHQQVSLAAGRTIYSRLCAALGARGLCPDAVIRCPTDALRRAGLSDRKCSYLRDLAAATRDGRVAMAELARLDDEEVIEALCAIKGIGRWSAQMFLLFELRRLDVFPSGDLGFQRGIERIYGLRGRPSAKRLESLRRRWSPYASVASWYCWRALDAGGV